MDEQKNIRVTPVSLRNFIVRLNNASVRRKDRFQQLEEIRGRVEELSSEPIEKNFYAEDVKKELKRVSLELKKAEEEEKLISIKQRNDENEANEAKRRIDELANKIEAVGHLASISSQEQFRRLEEMEKAFIEEHPARIAEQPEVHEFLMKKIKPLGEKKPALVKKEHIPEGAIIVENAPEESAAERLPKPKVHHTIIRSIEKQISDAEKMHKKLQNAGHPPERLEILKDKIDMHRRRLNELKETSSVK